MTGEVLLGKFVINVQCESGEKSDQLSIAHAVRDEARDGCHTRAQQLDLRLTLTTANQTAQLTKPSVKTFSIT